MSRGLTVAVAILLLAACGSSPPEGAERPQRPERSTPAARAPSTEAVDTTAIVATLRRLEGIAKAHGGNRAAGTPGGEASIDEVAARLRRAGYAVSTQAVPFPFFRERSRPQVELAGRPLTSRDVRTLAYSAGGRAEGSVARVAGLGCAAGDYARAARGAIALVDRGRCTLRRKALAAQRAGAAALLVVNDGSSGGTGTFAGTLGAPGLRIPVLGTSAAAGRSLARAGARVKLRVDAVSERRRTRNLIAETRTGREEGRIILGAHVDSVPAGPGINDNGTGVAALVEIAERLAASGRPAHRRVTFAFWGAEELGLYGSRRYVASLPRAEREAIGAYVNLDMVGSPNPVRHVYDGAAGPPGSQRIEAALRGALRDAGLAVAETRLGGGSDHAPFARAGIPVGGLFSGAEREKTAAQARRFGGREGRPLDPCYHRGCDTVANVDDRIVGQLTRAAAEAVAALAGE